ncbi:MAG: hypothetical protein PHN56_06360 [Candidatus Nanoarchaeia archaeon]|nr:hypothetical protein [Candidatus Nanoarchaeia archaeon]
MRDNIKIIKECNKGKVVSVKVLDLRIGEEKELELMHGSGGNPGNSLSSTEMYFSYDNDYDVRFRFDFGDCVEGTENPKLDADFYDRKGKRHIKINKKFKFYEKHHTDCLPDTRMYVFETEFEKLIFEIVEITTTSGIAAIIDLEYPQ